MGAMLADGERAVVHAGDDDEVLYDSFSKLFVSSPSLLSLSLRLRGRQVDVEARVAKRYPRKEKQFKDSKTVREKRLSLRALPFTVCST